MPKYTVIEPLGYDRPAPYMPGEVVDLDEKEVSWLIKAGVIDKTPLPDDKVLNVADTVKLVQAAATIEELDALAEGESRKGVLTAIEVRRKELEG
jgi:hypothetical protein